MVGRPSDGLRPAAIDGLVFENAQCRRQLRQLLRNLIQVCRL